MARPPAPSDVAKLMEEAEADWRTDGCAEAVRFSWKFCKKNWTELVHSEDNMQELQIHGVETAIWKGGKTKFPEFPPTIHSTYTYTCTSFTVRGSNVSGEIFLDQ